MSEITLNATLRKTLGKSTTQLIRKNGKIPAVLYGPRGNYSLEMEEESTRQNLEKLNNSHELVHLKINDSNGENWEGNVLLKEIQKHSYKNKLIHLDFLEPSKDKPLNLKVQIREKGECPGVKQGGVLQYVVREIPVSCMAENIPSYIEVDVTKLMIGQTLKVQEIPLSEKMQLKTKQNFPIISVVGRTKALEEEVGEDESMVEGQESEEADSDA
jgi:large subunit ribosomal protein L25